MCHSKVAISVSSAQRNAASFRFGDCSSSLQSHSARAVLLLFCSVPCFLFLHDRIDFEFSFLHCLPECFVLRSSWTLSVSFELRAACSVKLREGQPRCVYCHAADQYCEHDQVSAWYFVPGSSCVAVHCCYCVSDSCAARIINFLLSLRFFGASVLIDCVGLRQATSRS